MDNYIDKFKQDTIILIAGHVALLKEKYNREPQFSQSRLETFNLHLDILRGELQGKIKEILTDVNNNAPAEYNYIEAVLWELYGEYINDFFRSNFDTGNKKAT